MIGSNTWLPMEAREESASTTLTATPPPGGCRQRSRHITTIASPNAKAATHSAEPNQWCNASPTTVAQA
ncbi:hypothetical protein D3C77_553330 [compost metagenome]